MANDRLPIRAVSEAVDGAQCGLCGLRPARSRISYSHEVPPDYRRMRPRAEQAALQMALCAVCGDRVLKHLKRIFTLQQLGIRPRGEA